MKRFTLVFICIISIVLFQCEKEDNSPDEYLTATIDGNEYNAKWLKARKYTDNDGRNWLEISSATINLEQSNSNSDYETISFSLIDNCLKPGAYNYEFILNESGTANDLYPFLYLYQYYDLKENSTYGYSGSDINVVVSQINYTENGIIKGEFEFVGANGINTVQVKDGKFKLKIEE